MSQPAQKRPAPPTELPIRDEDGSGRFVIAADGRVEPMLPPAGPAEEILSLDAIGGLELASDAEIDVRPPAPPATVSGVFATGPRADDADALADGIASMRPYYTDAERKSERAELLVEDLSLRFDNPYAASSLVPPPRKPLPVAKIVGIAAAVIALGAGALFIARTTENARPHTTARALSVAPSAHIAPSAAAPSVVAPQVSAVTDVAATAAVVPAAPAAPEQRAHIAPVVIEPEVHAVVAAPPAAPRVRATTHDTADDALRAVLKNEPTETKNEAIETPAAVETAPTVAAGEAAPSSAVAPEATPSDALGALPDLPSREQIVAGFEQARAAIDTCAAGKHGVVKIDATIANSGRVAHAVIDGSFVGTPEGSCIARAVRATRFPAFSQASLKVEYPIAL